MKLLSKKEEKKTEQEKVEERREQVLAAGRKFKYPLQWTRHRVVMNTILIALVVFGIVITGGYLALYQFGMTDDMLFRITKILPVPVAIVDGEAVRFSDYLMFYRSSMISIDRQSGQASQNPIEVLQAQYKRAALTEAEEFAFALKIAKEREITVSDEEVETEFQRHLNIGGVERSEEGFLKIVEENFGLDKEEYRRMLYLTLMRAKVEMEIDERANEIANRVESLIKETGGDYAKIAEVLGGEIEYQDTGGMVSSQNIDGGRASEAIKLSPGEESGRFVSMNGDGYYFVKLIEKTDTEVNFVSIMVPFTEFKREFAEMTENGGIDEYITIKEITEE